MFESYQQTEAFFDSRKSLGIKPGLDRIYSLLDLLGNPQTKIRAIHIAGTNGKGSTVQFIKNALQANGFRIGVFSSPSLTGLTGHVGIDDTFISEEVFLDLCNEIYPAIRQLDNRNMSPTEFEIITALAFLFFSKTVDIAIIEAGMGGRDDTTNCFSPALSIITNVAKDHTQFLGESLKEIAYHKAGIIKKHVPVILGEMELEALEVMETEIYDKKTKSYQLGDSFTYKLAEKIAGTQQFSWRKDNELHMLSIQILGEHQVKNASIAFMALKLLSETGLKVNTNKSIDAIKSTRVPGRFEIIQHNPIIVLDGAHNPAGIDTFLQTVTVNYNEKPKHLIFSAFKDKDLETMLNKLSGHFETITVTTFQHPRAASAEDLYRLTQAETKRIATDFKTAIKQIDPSDGNYFITGSLNFIAQVREYLLSHN